MKTHKASPQTDDTPHDFGEGAPEVGEASPKVGEGCSDFREDPHAETEGTKPNGHDTYGIFAVPPKLGEHKRIDWILPGLIARREGSVLCADPFVGKTTVTTYIIARLTAGRQSFGQAPARPMRVLLSTPETNLDTSFWPAFDAQGGDRANVRVINAEAYNTRGLLRYQPEVVAAQFGGFKPDVIVVDPLVSHTPDDKNLNQAEHARGLLEAGIKLARFCNAGFLALCHLNKDEAQKMLYRVAGSVQIIATPRLAFALVRHPDAACTLVLGLIGTNLPCDFGDQKITTYKIEGTDAIAAHEEGPSDETVGEIAAGQSKTQFPTSPTKCIRAMLRAFPGETLTNKQVCTLYDHLDSKQVARAISRMAKEGKVVAIGNGSFRAPTAKEQVVEAALELEMTAARAERALARLPPGELEQAKAILETWAQEFGGSPPNPTAILGRAAEKAREREALSDTLQRAHGRGGF